MPPTVAFTGSREIPHGNDNAKAAEQGPIPAHLLPAVRTSAASPKIGRVLHPGEEDEVPTPQRVRPKARPQSTAQHAPPPTLRHHTKGKPGPALVDSPKAETPATAEVSSSGAILDGALIAELHSLRSHLTAMAAGLRDKADRVEATIARVDSVITTLADANKKEYKAPPDRLAKIRAAQAKRTTEERRASALKGHQKRREAMGGAY